MRGHSRDTKKLRVVLAVELISDSGVTALFRAQSQAIGAPRHRSALRLAMTLAILILCLWFSRNHVAGLSWADLRASIAALTGVQWLSALAAVTVAFLAVAGQERAIVQHLGYRLDPAHARGAAMAAAAVSQTLGFGPVIGAIVRRRLLPSLSTSQSFAISATLTLAFFMGLGLLLLALVALQPIHPLWHEAAVALGLAAIGGIVVAVLPWQSVMGVKKPSVFTVLRLTFWVGLDVLCLGLAFWVLLPPEATPPLLDMLPVFTMALGVGLASGSPAGAGPFEATVLTAMPQISRPDLLAGILAFRFVAYALPATLGALWALIGRRILPAPRLAGLDPVPMPCPVMLANLPRAEVQLSRGGEVQLMAGPDNALWLSGGLPGLRVMLGDPVAADATPSPLRLTRRALDHARCEGRMPVFYKVGPMTATALRRQGLTLLPIAREAVLNPQTFTLDGSARAGLRRKLRHAAQAGVTVEAPARPPLTEMAAIADIWAARQGGERGWSMGRWSRSYVAGQRVFCARNAEGRLLAFVSFHAAAGEWVLDLIRAGDAVPDGTLYALVVKALEVARAEDVPRLSLAAVPMADLGFSQAGLPPRLLAPWRQSLAAAGGLQQFKQAFAPKWETRYLATKGLLTLAVAGLMLARTINRPSKAQPATTR